MALAAHGAGRSRGQARRGWRGRDRLRHGVPRARSHVARQHAALLAEVGGPGRLESGGREASLQRPGLRRGDRQGPGRARLHRRAARNLHPRDQGRLRPWRRRSEAVRAPLPRRCGQPQRIARQGARSRLAQLDPRARPDHPPHAHGGQSRRHALSLLCRRHAETRPRRFDLCREVLRRERREGVRRADRHRGHQGRRFRGSHRGERPDVDQVHP